MSIRIGHASRDENIKAHGGSAGDQDKKEVCIRTWYSNPWNVVLRAKDASVREDIAKAMEMACKNDKIGYDQYQRNTLLAQARKVDYNPGKVTTKCECDCSSLVALCCMYAGIKESAVYKDGNSATTRTLRKWLLATGKFEELTASKYLTKDSYLLRGDILLKEGSHVTVVLDDGDMTSEKVSTIKVDPAKSFNKSLKKTYTTTSDLNLRAGAGTAKDKITVIKKGDKVNCYGYYTTVSGTKWLYVTYGKYTGFCSSKYLK